MQKPLYSRRLAAVIAWVSITLIAAGGMGAAIIVIPQLRGWVINKAAPTPPPFAVGEPLGGVPAVYTGTEFTAVLFTQDSCGACKRAAPYVKTLAMELAKRRSFRFVVMPLGLVSTAAQEYGARLGVDGLSVLPATEEIIARVPSVPTLLIVDRLGRIRFTHYAGFGSDGQALTLASRIFDQLKMD